MAKFDGKTYTTSGICTALEHLKLIDQHFQTLVKNSTMAINTAKLLAGDAIQALNHKDLNGGLFELPVPFH
jgi:hypothetical protein